MSWKRTCSYGHTVRVYPWHLKLPANIERPVLQTALIFNDLSVSGHSHPSVWLQHHERFKLWSVSGHRWRQDHQNLGLWHESRYQLPGRPAITEIFTNSMKKLHVQKVYWGLQAQLGSKSLQKLLLFLEITNKNSGEWTVLLHARWIMMNIMEILFTCNLCNVRIFFKKKKMFLFLRLSTKGVPLVRPEKNAMKAYKSKRQ